MLKFIHITDIHLKSANPNRDHKKIIAELIIDLVDYVDNNTLLFFTGDFSDKFSVKFQDFSKLIFNPIIEKFPILKNRIFFVPGNHDLDRSKIDITDNMLKTQILSDVNSREKIYKKYISNGNKGLEEFEQYTKEFYADFDGEKSLSNYGNSFILILLSFGMNTLL